MIGDFRGFVAKPGERAVSYTHLDVYKRQVLLQILGLLTLQAVHSEAGALVYIVLFGAGSGTMTIMRAALLAERYGPAHYGRISGILNMAQMLARTAAVSYTHLDVYKRQLIDSAAAAQCPVDRCV